MGTARKLLDSKGHDILSVEPESTVLDALKEMEDIAAGTALVFNGDQLAGIISERDCSRKVVLKKKDPATVKVKEIMSTSLTTVSPDETLEQCLSLMTDKRIRHLPVVDSGKCIGVISIGDCVKYMLTEKSFMIKNLENYISGTGMN
jgi:CBS domain-containing protein